MKNKIALSSLFSVLLGISLYFFSAYAQNSANLSNSLKVSIESSKSAYLLGEVVVINVELKNESSSDIFLQGTDAKSGYLKILISNSQGNFKEYTNAAWGNKKKPGKTLKPEQTVKSQATVLSNSKPEVSHLNETAAERAAEGKILTDYAFPHAGIYYLKALLIIPGENSTRIESDTIQITVNKPIGDDLEVWNKIKNRSDIAYFIQESSVIARSDEEKEIFLQEVEQTAMKFPNSLLANQLRQSLEKFQANEERRKEFEEKLKQQRKN